MTTFALILAALALAVVLRERHLRRRQRRWEHERQRIEARDERIAAHNGHPDGHVLAVMPVNGFDHPEPEELA